jgi:carbon-monoxide dehydrogenase small subunit
MSERDGADVPRRWVRVEVNGRPVESEVEPRLLLVHFLRWTAGLRGTRVGCDTTSCGACAVLLDGRAVKSCTVFAVQADGHRVTTVEGLAPDGAPLHRLQEAFWAEHGLQCGYCTPGLLMAAIGLVEGAGGELRDEDVREAISGNLCRCTGYVNVVAAIRRAARPAQASGPSPGTEPERPRPAGSDPASSPGRRRLTGRERP